MNKTDFLRFWKHHLRTTVPRALCFYILAPFAALWLFAGAAREAVLRSDTAALWLLPAAALAAVLNWAVYRAVRGRRPTLLVYAFGLLCLAAAAAIVHLAYPSDHYMVSALAAIAGALLLAGMLLFSFWCASRRNKFAHSTAVVLWVLLFLAGVAMAFQAARDIEVRAVSADTWIALISLALLILGACSPRILASRRRDAARRRKTGLAEGRIVQVVGETHLDRDDDLVTVNHCRVAYTVDGVPYEARAAVSRFDTRRFGRKNFIGRAVPVFYDPANPADAYVRKIDRHLFDAPEDGEESGG